MTPYTTYYVWITAFNAIGDSAPLAGSGAAGTAPTAPATVSVDGTTDPFGVTATWADSSDNESGFNVYWSTDDTQPATLGATVAAGVTTYKMNKVLAAQTYRFWVESANTVGKSTATKGTATAATTDPGWNELWLDGGTGIHMAGKDPYLATAATTLYAYHSATTDMGTAKPMNAEPVKTQAWIILDTKNDSIDVTKAHNFWFETRTATGSLFSLRTLAPGAVAPITNIAITPADATAALTWDVPTGYTGTYQVLFGTGTFATAALGATRTVANANVTNLLPGTDYNFWVRTLGVGIGGNGFPAPATLATAKTTGINLGANLAADGGIVEQQLQLGRRWQYRHPLGKRFQRQRMDVRRPRRGHQPDPRQDGVGGCLLQDSRDPSLRRGLQRRRDCSRALGMASGVRGGRADAQWLSELGARQAQCRRLGSLRAHAR